MRKAAWTIPVVVAAAGAAAWGMWVGHVPEVRAVAVRVPGTDRPAGSEGAEAVVDLRGVFTKGEGVAGMEAGEWPGFRGGMRTGISGEGVTLSKEIGSPRVLWQAEVGEGYGGAAVKAGRVYLLDYNKEKVADALRCLSLEDGREIWRREYRVDVKYNHGRTRTVPAVGEKVVVTLGPKCHVLCVDRESGEYLWGKDMVREYGTKVPPWYAGQCPLIENAKLETQNAKPGEGEMEGSAVGGGERVILAPAGGEVLMVALEAGTGKEIWRVGNEWGWTMTHSSIGVVEFGGRRMYVYCGSGGVVGVDAADGKVLWETREWKVSLATVATPVDLGEGRVLFSGGYGAGAVMVELVEKTQNSKLKTQNVLAATQKGAEVAGREFGVEVVRRFGPEEFGAEQQTPIFYGGEIYGVIPGGEMVCMDREGKTRWRSGGGQRFGLGPFVAADGAIYAVNDTGVLSVVEGKGEGFKLLSRAAVLQGGHESWGPLAVAGGRLLMRDLTRLVCVDVRGGR